MKKVKLSEEEWKKKLSLECYRICRGKGTERPFANQYWDCHEHGIYHCIACGEPIFSSTDKFDSGSGWPSFSKPIDQSKIQLIPDHSHSMIRIEVVCSIHKPPEESVFGRV